MPNLCRHIVVFPAEQISSLKRRRPFLLKFENMLVFNVYSDAFGCRQEARQVVCRDVDGVVLDQAGNALNVDPIGD